LILFKTVNSALAAPVYLFGKCSNLQMRGPVDGQRTARTKGMKGAVTGAEVRAAGRDRDRGWPNPAGSSFADDGTPTRMQPGEGGRWRSLLGPRLAAMLAPRLDAPLPLWMIFPVIFAVLYASHWSLLRLPYYWDEAGYYIPAAWDFFRTGALIPITTVSNAHPPLPSVYLTLWWLVCGFHPEVTREAVLIVASLGLLAVWRMAIRLNGNTMVAFWTVLLTGLYPIWFAQSTLAHADIFAAAATLWALVCSLPGDDPAAPKPKYWGAAIWFSVAVLAKETAIATPLALAVYELAVGLRYRPELGMRAKRAAWYCVCVAPLAAWYGYHYAKTGYLFGNPEFLRYNATATLTPMRILAAFGHRMLHLTAHMNLFVPVLCTAAAMALDPIKSRAGDLRARVSFAAQRRILVILLANAVLFSVLGGALLTRYLLPMYPLILLLAVSTFHRRVRYWHFLAMFSAAGFLVALTINPPYGFAPEDNLSYARVIRLHQRAIHELVTRYPGSTVLTAWPASDELTKPELGYVKEPFEVDRIEDFTAAQIALAAAHPEEYSTALVFSTKAEPDVLPFHLNSPAVESEYFGLHYDLPPQAIAQQLGGEIAWHDYDNLEWAAVLRFHRAVVANAELPAAR
jgi:hypothetical protein